VNCPSAVEQPLGKVMIAGWRSKTVTFIAILFALLTFGALATASADPRDLAQSADIAAAQALHSRGLAAWREGKYSEAEGLYKRAWPSGKKALAATPPARGQPLHNLCLVHAAQRKYSEAEGVYKRALAIREAALGAKHPDVAWTLHNLALVYWTQGRYS